MNLKHAFIEGVALTTLAVATGCSAPHEGQPVAAPISIETTVAPANTPETIDPTAPLFTFEFGTHNFDPAAPLNIDATLLPTKDITLAGAATDKDGTTTYPAVAYVDIHDLTADYTTLLGADDPLNQAFLKALGDAQPLIEAAIKRGTLSHILLTRSTSDDVSAEASHYNPIGKAVDIVVDESTMSFDELATTVKHELWHSLTYNAPFADTAWQDTLDSLCPKVDKLYLPETTAFIDQVTEQLLALYQANKAVNPDEYNKFTPVLEVIDKALKAGEDTDKILQSCGSVAVLYSLEGVYKEAANLPKNVFSDVYDLSRSKVLAALPDTDPLKRNVYIELIEPAFSLYADLDESAYIQSSSVEAKFFGHAAANSDELYASTLDILTHYTDAFALKISAMRPEERDVMLAYVRLIVNDTIAANPSLLGMLSQAEATVFNKVSATS